MLPARNQRLAGDNRLARASAAITSFLVGSASTVAYAPFRHRNRLERGSANGPDPGPRAQATGSAAQRPALPHGL
jgi:hypothetical protein